MPRPSVNVDFAHIREARERHGYSLRTLADAITGTGLYVNRATLSRIERGKKGCGPAIAQALHDVLGLD